MAVTREDAVEEFIDALHAEEARQFYVRLVGYLIEGEPYTA